MKLNVILAGQVVLDRYLDTRHRDVVNPIQKGQVITCALVKVLKEVVMSVDKAGQHRLAMGVYVLLGDILARERVGRPYRDNSILIYGHSAVFQERLFVVHRDDQPIAD